MRVWLPFLTVGSGADVFTRRLARALSEQGAHVDLTAFTKRWQYTPGLLRAFAPPPGTSAIIADSNIAFAFAGRGIPVCAVEHHCVLDPAYRPHRSFAQAVYHELFVRRFTTSSLKRAAAVVAVSQYTADSLFAALGGPRAHVIPNAIETDFFTPGAPKEDLHGRPVRLLFVGNLIRRKGADLLPRIMERLGAGFELRYTSGLRTDDPFAGAPGMIPLGRLTQEELRDQYRAADLLLFPTRFEGFGYVAAEAMACGTPVVATRCSSLPEIVDDGVTGRLCPLDAIDAFAEAVRDSTSSDDRLRTMSAAASAAARHRFALKSLGQAYAALLDEVVSPSHTGTEPKAVTR